MAYFDFMAGAAPSGNFFQGIYDASAAVGAQVGLGEVRTADTVVTDSVQAQTPITPPEYGAQMSGFWAGLNGALSTITNTEVARYQARRLITGTAPASEDTKSQAPPDITVKSGKALSPGVLIGGLALLGLAAYFALKR